MRRDSIFYKLFQQSPALVFELLNDPPENAQAYRFDSVAVKEPRFEIDGVFLPPDTDTGVVYFCEVQFQKDKLLYERVFAESALYFYRNRSRFSDWQAVVIYPTRKLEQDDVYPHRGLLTSEQVHRVYLDELGEIRDLPLWVAVMVLTTVEPAQAPEEARYLLSRTQQESSEPISRAIIELITTIMTYRFEHLSRREIEAMLDITLKETRVYQELKEEIQEEIRAEAIEEGREVEAIALITRLLNRRLRQNLSEEMRSRLSTLPLPILEDLGEALLEFTSLSDLAEWLAAHE